MKEAQSPAPAGARGSTISAQVEKLRAQLTSTVGTQVESAIAVACNDFARAWERKASSMARGTPAHQTVFPLSLETPDEDISYDTYYKCCRRLVQYISENMKTCPEFVQQMDRIILACHSEAPESVLSSVVTKSLWFHRYAQDDDAEDSAAEEENKENVKMANSEPVKREPRHSVDESPVAVIPPRPKGKRGRPRKIPREEEPAPVVSPKRPRRETRSRRSLPADLEPMEVEDDNEQSDNQDNSMELIEGEVADDNPSAYEKNDAEEEESAALAPAKPKRGRGRPTHPHVDVRGDYNADDELLSFKDAIGELCFADKRTPAQTKFFKDRLAKSITFVDAQLCQPPPGLVCSRECRKIRSQMCNRDLPCKNKMCRIWHDVEAHTDRCRNTQCEFRNRVMLRETMHKIDRKKIELQKKRAENQRKTTELNDIKKQGGDANEREAYIEVTLLENELGELERDVEKCEQELGVLKATKNAFLACLGEIGITEDDDAKDGLPDFHTHYVTKKQTPNKQRGQVAKKDDEVISSTPTRRNEPRGGRRGTGPHGQVAAQIANNIVDEEPKPGTPYSFRRTTRRSTQISAQRFVASGQVIEIDDDEEEGEEENSNKEKNNENGKDNADDENGDEQEDATRADEKAASDAKSPERKVAAKEVNHAEPVAAAKETAAASASASSKSKTADDDEDEANSEEAEEDPPSAEPKTSAGASAEDGKDGEEEEEENVPPKRIVLPERPLSKHALSSVLVDPTAAEERSSDEDKPAATEATTDTVATTVWAATAMADHDAAAMATVSVDLTNGDHQRQAVLMPDATTLRTKKRGGRQKDPIWQETTICEDKTVLCNRCHAVIHRYGCTKVERVRLHFEKRCLQSKRQKTAMDGTDTDGTAAKMRACSRTDYTTKMGLFRRRIARWLFASGQDFHEIENKLLVDALRLLRTEVALPTKLELENELLDVEFNASVNRVNRELSAKTCTLTVEKWRDFQGQEVTNYGAIVDDGRSFFLECTTASAQETTLDTLADDIERVILKHKRALFIGIMAPTATDITKSLRERVLRKTPPTMFFHGCVCHALRLLIKDVCTIVPWLAVFRESVTESFKVLEETNKMLQLRDRFAGLLITDVGTMLAGSFCDSLEVLLKAEKELIAIVTKRDFVDSLSPAEEQARTKRVQDFVLGESFFQDLANALTLLKPLQAKLMHFETDSRATISQVYHCYMELLDLYANMEAINKKEKALITSCVNERFELIYGEAHGVSYVLDPVYLGQNLTPAKEESVNAFIANSCVGKPDPDMMMQLTRYKEMVQQLKECNQGYWELLVSRSVRPLDFWTERRQFPELQKLAWLVFSLPATSTSASKTFCPQTQMVHAKFAAQLPVPKVRKLTHIYCNSQISGDDKDNDLSATVLKDVHTLRYTIKRDGSTVDGEVIDVESQAADTEDETVIYWVFYVERLCVGDDDGGSGEPRRDVHDADVKEHEASPPAPAVKGPSRIVFDSDSDQDEEEEEETQASAKTEQARSQRAKPTRRITAPLSPTPRALRDDSGWTFTIHVRRIRGLRVPVAAPSLVRPSGSGAPDIAELHVFATVDKQGKHSLGSTWKEEAVATPPTTQHRRRNARDAAVGGLPSPGMVRRSGLLQEATWKHQDGVLTWKLSQDTFRHLKAYTPRLKLLVYGVGDNMRGGEVPMTALSPAKSMSKHTGIKGVVSCGWFFLDLRCVDLLGVIPESFPEAVSMPYSRAHKNLSNSNEQHVKVEDKVNSILDAMVLAESDSPKVVNRTIVSKIGTEDEATDAQVQKQLQDIELAKLAFLEEKNAWKQEQKLFQMRWRRKLAEMEKARMDELEDEWARREEERSGLLKQAQLEYQDLEQKLRLSLQDVEARERKLIAAEAAFQRDRRVFTEETELAKRRQQTEHAHAMLLAKKNMESLEQRARTLEEQLMHAERRTKQVEADFADYRMQQRKVPEARLREEIASLKGQLVELERQKVVVEKERDQAEAKAANLKLQLDQAIDRLRAEKKKYEARSAEELEKLRLKYVAREEKYVLDGDREELRAIKRQLDELRRVSLDRKRMQPSTHHSVSKSSATRTSMNGRRTSPVARRDISGVRSQGGRRDRNSLVERLNDGGARSNEEFGDESGSVLEEDHDWNDPSSDEENAEPVVAINQPSGDHSSTELKRLERERHLLLSSGAYTEDSALVRELDRLILLSNERSQRVQL
ncbi:TPA: hypothetical protein N0F65_010043 [Lagenidium giganteum]|uniref:DUF659 domain-containing protein n=1 Tax=Lagenidium giganteum TaxID=4803 RepID=A0AAV2ZCH8_9STRA|nr:TPA: hypothetical protein N0F65_010043 [Lagenidium giganteum]